MCSAVKSLIMLIPIFKYFSEVFVFNISCRYSHSFMSDASSLMIAISSLLRIVWCMLSRYEKDVGFGGGVLLSKT